MLTRLKSSCIATLFIILQGVGTLRTLKLNQENLETLSDVDSLDDFINFIDTSFYFIMVYFDNINFIFLLGLLPRKPPVDGGDPPEYGQKSKSLTKKTYKTRFL